MTPLNPMAGGGLRDEWWDEITVYPACTLTDTYITYIHKIHTQHTNITFLHKETNSILECHFWSVECSGVQRPVDARDKLYDLDGCSESILWFWNSHSCLSMSYHLWMHAHLRYRYHIDARDPHLIGYSSPTPAGLCISFFSANITFWRIWLQYFNICLTNYVVRLFE